MDASLYTPSPPAAGSGPSLDLDRMAAWLRPLGSPVRLRVLRYLTQPHYLEEVSSALKMSRQATRKHLYKLVQIGVVQKKPGMRDTGPVVEYVINSQALFLIYNEFEKIGTLRPRQQEGVMVATLSDGGRPARAQGPVAPCLTVVRGFNMGLRVPLVGNKEWVLGRDERCDVVFAHDPFASNRQAMVSRDHGRFMLTDLQSTNGTEHNWSMLPRGGATILDHGDVIGIGKTVLLFWEH